MRTMIGLALALGFVINLAWQFAYAANEQAPPAAHGQLTENNPKPIEPPRGKRPSAPVAAETAALSYLRVWSKQDFGAMWEAIEHEGEKNWWPWTESKESFRRKMARFPGPIRSPQIRHVGKQLEGIFAVRYVVQAPLLGCLTFLFLHGPPVEMWPTIRWTAPFFGPIEGEIQVNARGKVIFDSSDLLLLIHQASKIGAPAYPFPETPGRWLYSKVNALLVAKHRVPVEEWLKAREAEQKRCDEAAKFVRP